MSDRSKDTVRPRIEMFVIGVIILVTMIWMVTKCNNSRLDFEEDTIKEETPEEASNSPAAQIIEKPLIEEVQEEIPKKKKEPSFSTIKEKITPLYVTIGNLKLRDKPSLEGRVLTSLELFEEVSYLNEITEFKQEINLGFEVANEPWVKVKTERGYIGWVYGAGVHFYKRKREPEKKDAEAQEEEEQ